MVLRIVRLISPFVVPAVLLALIGGLGLSLARSQADDKVHTLRTELDQQLRWEDQLRRENRRLDHLIEALWNTHSLDQKIAREEGNLVRPGDVIFQFPAPK